MSHCTLSYVSYFLKSLTSQVVRAEANKVTDPQLCGASYLRNLGQFELVNAYGWRGLPLPRRGWHQTNLLVALAGVALCWYTWWMTSGAHASFLSDEPETTALTDQDLAEVVDYAGALR